MRLLPSGVLFTVLLGLIAGLPALSIDLSAPTLVELPAALNTTTVVAGFTLSLFMAGFAVGQIVSGRVSDQRGRRPVLLLSLLMYASAGVLCSIATSGPILAACRMLQGMGAGGCAVLAYAIVQDLFEGEAARSRRSYVTVVLGLTPVLAPTLGVYLDQVWGWRSVHVVLVIAGCALLAVVAGTVSESRWVRPSRPMLAAGRLRDDGRFILLAVVNGLSYGAVFAYIAGAPVVVMGHLQFAPFVYAKLFASTALALSAGAFASGRLGRLGVSAGRLVWPGLLAQAGTSLLLGLFVARYTPDSAAVAVPLLVVFAFARGLTAPNLIHLAVSNRHNDAGAASAVLGVLQLTLGALASAAVAWLLPILGPQGATLPMAFCAAGAVVLWLIATRQSRRIVPSSGT